MFELLLNTGLRVRLPPEITPTQLHVGGDPRARFVRAYGSDAWFTVQDQRREPAPFPLQGFLHTDRNESLINDLLAELERAVDSTTALVQVDREGRAVQWLPLLGALPITAEPDGIDSTLLFITIPLVPALDEWLPGGPPPLLLLDSGAVMLLDTGAKAVQQ